MKSATARNKNLQIWGSVRPSGGKIGEHLENSKIREIVAIQFFWSFLGFFGLFDLFSLSDYKSCCYLSVSAYMLITLSPVICYLRMLYWLIVSDCLASMIEMYCSFLP